MAKTNKKAALYIRVSTIDQHPENQYQELEKYCRYQDIAIAETYIDRGESGLKTNRPAFNRLLKDMRSRKFNAVIIWKLDRIGRSLQHLLQILSEFQNKKIDLIVTTQNIDTTTREGKLMFQIMGAFAEYESGLNSERTKIGMSRARNEGKRIGRPPKDPSIYNHYCIVSGCRIKVEQGRRLCDKHRKYNKMLQKKGGSEI